MSTTRQSKSEREYVATITYGRQTATVETFATSRGQAIRNVRRQMRDDGIKGRLTITAVVKPDVRDVTRSRRVSKNSMRLWRSSIRG